MLDLLLCYLKKIKTPFLFLFLFFNITVFGQMQYKGKVIDGQTLKPVSQAYVQIDTLKEGVYTNRSGWFEIEISNTDPRTFYISHEFYIDIKITAVFGNNLLVLNDRRKNNNLWAISKNFKNLPTHSQIETNTKPTDISAPSNAALLLQNNIPGLTISRPGNNPNDPFQIFNRGLSSATQRIYPLIVVDGIPEMSLERINPEDIASIKVIKSAVGSAKYGALGGGGVIELNTMDYDTSMASIQYHSSLSMQFTQASLPIMDVDEYRKYKPDYDQQANTNWIKEITREAISTRHHLSISEGNATKGIIASLGYEKENGILKRSGFEQGNIRINYFKKSKDGKKIWRIKNHLLQRNNNFSTPYLFWQALLFNPTIPLRDSLGEHSSNSWNTPNPNYYLERAYNLGRTRDWSSVIKQEVFSSPKNKTEFLLAIRHRKNIFGTAYVDGGFGDYYYSNTFNKKHITGQIISTKNKSRKKINVKKAIGIKSSVLRDENQQYNTSFENIEDVNFKNIEKPSSFWNTNNSERDKEKWTRYIASAFLERSYNWNVFNFDLGFHYDHIFLEGNNQGELFFHSAISADLTNFLNFNWINESIISVGFGKAGQPTSSNFSYNNALHNSLFAGEFMTSSLNDEKLLEIKTELDVQIDLSLFDNQLNARINFYDNLLYDQFIRSFGFNYGDLGNKGVEINIDYHKKFNQQLFWKTQLGFYSNKSVAYRVSNGGEQITVAQAVGRFEFSDLILEPYKEVSQFFGFETSAEPVEGQFIPISNDGIPARKKLGRTTPLFNLAFNNQFKFKNWDLNFKIRSVVGHYLFNFQRKYGELVQGGDNNIVSTKYFNENRNTFSNLFLDLYIENASFVKLDYLSIGYTPTIKKGNLRIYISGHDLLTLTGYTGIDPEPIFQYDGIALGSGQTFNQQYYRSRRIAVGAQISFK